VTSQCREAGWFVVVSFLLPVFSILFRTNFHLGSMCKRVLPANQWMPTSADLSRKEKEYYPPNIIDSFPFFLYLQISPTLTASLQRDEGFRDSKNLEVPTCIVLDRWTKPKEQPSNARVDCRGI
jgi:hypothetical protein